MKNIVEIQNVRKLRFIYLFKKKWNNKIFRIFWNSRLGYFPIENINGKIIYPEYDDYIEIYKFFQKENEKKRIILLLKGDWKVPNLVTRNKNEKKVILFKPFVRLGTALISAWMALSMAGCTISLNNNEQIRYVIEDESIKSKEDMLKDESTNINEEALIDESINQNVEISIDTENTEGLFDQSIDFTEEEIQEVIDKFHKRQIELEYNHILKRFIIKKEYDSAKECYTVYVDNQNELREYFPNENQHPTYKDIHNGIDENTNIPIDIKQKFHICINRIQEKYPNMDLFALNMNIKRITVEVENNEYDPNKKYENPIARCVPGNIIIYNFNNLPIDIIGHELGHNFFHTYRKIDENTMIIYEPAFRDVEYFPEIQEYYRSGLIHEQTEGIANLIAKECSGNELLNSDEFYFYIQLTEGTNTLLECSGTTLEEYSKIGYVGWLEKITNSGVSDVVERIVSLNHLYYYLPSEKPSYTFSEWRKETIKEFLDYQIENGTYVDSNLEKMIESIYANKIIYIFSNGEIVEEYIPEELRREVKSYLRQEKKCSEEQYLDAK